MENKAKEDGLGQISCLAMSQETPPRGFVPKLSLGKPHTVTVLALCPSPASGHGRIQASGSSSGSATSWPIGDFGQKNFFFFFTSWSFNFLSCTIGMIIIV